MVRGRPSMKTGRERTMADEALQQELERLKADIARLRADLGAVSEALKATAAAQAEAARERAREKAEQARENLQQKVDEALSAGQQVAAQLDRKVADNPMTALLAAFGVGFVLAKMMDWSSRN
ncbi:MAG: DUF883 family protein [Gammaproteobacteria bacterium]|nr:MAG: DUF883 family protein [Gammaproteobacteria bacterium]